MFTHDAIEGKMAEVKGVGRRRVQLLVDLRNRRRYWELKEEAEDQRRWKRQFITRNLSYLPRVQEPTNKQHNNNNSNNNNNNNTGGS